MLATTHPDATAFTARFLAHPEDRLGRLVFADWLDEQGGDSNLAWAQYLRLMASIEEDADNVNPLEVESVGRKVRARLTLGKVPGTRLLSRLTALLPAHRVRVRIGGLQVPEAALVYCQEIVARLYGFMPIGIVGSHLFVVAAELFDSVRPDVENFLSCRVTAFRGDWGDVNRAVIAHSGGSTINVARVESSS